KSSHTSSVAWLRQWPNDWPPASHCFDPSEKSAQRQKTTVPSSQMVSDELDEPSPPPHAGPVNASASARAAARPNARRIPPPCRRSRAMAAAAAKRSAPPAPPGARGGTEQPPPSSPEGGQSAEKPPRGVGSQRAPRSVG